MKQPTQPTIIGLTGHAGAGKDTVASLLFEQHDSSATTIAFADALRSEVCKAYWVAMPLLTRRDTKETPSAWLALCNCEHTPFVRRMVEHYASGTRDGGIDGEALNLFAPRSPRQIMQWWGTEYRRHTSPGYWLAAMQDRIAFEQQEHDLIVITDVRFADEAQMVRDAGGQIWQVTRPGFGDSPARHVSETAGTEFSPSVVIHNSGSLGDLRERVAEALEVAASQSTNPAEDGIDVAQPLWAIHIPGPDEYHAAPSKEAADHMAAMHNKAMQEYVANNKLSWGIETITAHVAQWPYDFEAHTQELTEFDAAAWGLKDTTT